VTDRAAPEGFAVSETVAMRPGLAVPEWSALTDAEGRAALAASMAVAGRRERWAGLSRQEDMARRAVLWHFAAHGSGPDAAEVGAVTGLSVDAALASLRGLRARDLLVLDAAETQVIACYPFSAAPTPHLVLIGGRDRGVHALCAIDALGMGAMLGQATEVRSRCAYCGAAIIIRTAAAGRGLEAHVPQDAIVWSGIRYAGGCAATSGCKLKVFLCSDDHLRAWRSTADPGGEGWRLSLPVALRTGIALFGPMLAPTPCAGNAAA
jgi:hypothetical protein